MWTDYFRRRSVRAWIAAAVVIAAAAVFFLPGRTKPQPQPAATAPEATLREVALGEAVREKGLLVQKGQTAPFTGRLFENHPGGSRKVEIDVKDGRLHGHSKGWYANGQLEVDETFIEDFSDGQRTRWHANGTKKSVAMIRHGQLEGPYTEWHDNAQKSVEMIMQEGKPHGTAEAWHRSGALKSRTVLDQGKVVSRTFFDDPAAVHAKAAR